MTSFLFPATTASQGLRMRRTYGTVYTDIVRASSDAIDALSLYRRLIFTEGPGAENVGFAAFDAHVGDTSCQLRACMLLDMTRQHREWAAAGSGHVTWLDSYIEKLRKVHDNGREVLAKLTLNRIHPEKLGIGAEEDTPAGILNHLGWSEPEIPGCPEGLYPNLRETSSNGSGFQHSYERTEGLSLGAMGKFSVAVVQVGQPAEKKKPRAKAYVSPLLDNNNNSTDAAAAAWDPVDTRILARFLVYSFVLSKYKTFRQFKHTVGGRLHPEAAICEGDFMVHDVWEKSVCDYKYSKAPRRINQEFRALQTWISELSCAWLCHIAKGSTASPSIGSLMVQTLQNSSKNLMCIPTYVGYLAIRERWGKYRDSLILVDRHFCNEGYHSNFFLATLKLESTNAGSESGRPQHCLPLKHHVSWKIERISKNWLLDHPEQNMPHIIVMGNSIDGSDEDYMRANTTSQRHDEPDCSHNEEHILKFLAHDHDRLALSFFAQHRHYAFDLNGQSEEDGNALHEHAVVAEHMDHFFPELARKWFDSNKEADEMGTAGASLHMFGWQHVFTETKGRIAKMVFEARDTLPIAAPLRKLM